MWDSDGLSNWTFIHIDNRDGSRNGLSDSLCDCLARSSDGTGLFCSSDDLRDRFSCHGLDNSDDAVSIVVVAAASTTISAAVAAISISASGIARGRIIVARLQGND
jgi:hypothetical protein